MDDPTRGLGLAFLALAGSLGRNDKALLKQAIDDAYERLDREADEAPESDLRLGREFLELAEALLSEGPRVERIAN